MTLLQRDCLYDPNTGLPGPLLLADRLQVAVAGAMRAGAGIAVLVIRPDRLELLDASFGASVRDRVVAATAARLRAAVRPDETVALMQDGGFAVVLTGFENAQQIVTKAQTILSDIGKPSSIDGRHVRVTAALGVAVFPRDATVPEELLGAAMAAADAASCSGGNAIRYHAPDMEARSLMRLDIELRLRKAMKRSELTLDYQTKCSLASGVVSGAEALLRWLDAERGAISPRDFIPVAEETDLILGLGSWVIKRACAMLQERSRQGLPEVPIAVNMSVRQFVEQDVAELVRAALEETGVDPQLLQLEVTESLLSRDSGRALHTLFALKEMGVCLSLDDFGSGYFSLRELKHLPLDSLKIDPSFVRGMRSDDRDQAVVEAIVRTGHRLGFRVIAEGVETAWEADRLRDLGCDEAQGYFFQRPMPEQEFAKLIPAPHSTRLTGPGSDPARRKSDATLRRSA